MKKNTLPNDQGMALIIALILLLILTLIGISAITTTTYETSISGNERIGTDAFYASEAGIQIGLHRLPDTNPINRTRLGEDSHYWSGTPKDRNSPKPLQPFGLYPKGGFDSTWQFERFQINATGESFGAMKETEVQVTYGPFPGGTVYNN